MHASVRGRAAPPAALALVLVLLGLLAVAGCGGSGAADADATTSSSPSTPPSSSPSTAPPPALPAAAQQHTKAGAIAFVRHYIALINYAQATGSVDELERAGLESCRSCTSTTRFIARLYARGGRFEGGFTTVLQVMDAISPSEYGDYVVDVTIKIAPSVVHDNGTGRRARGGTNVLSVFPKWTLQGWRVAQWSRAK